MITHYDRLGSDEVPPAPDYKSKTSLASELWANVTKCPDATCKSSESGTEAQNLLTAESAGTQNRAFYLKKCFMCDFQPITSGS